MIYVSYFSRSTSREKPSHFKANLEPSDINGTGTGWWFTPHFVGCRYQQYKEVMKN
jgi:hypothetical protein